MVQFATSSSSFGSAAPAEEAAGSPYARVDADSSDDDMPGARRRRHPAPASYLASRANRWPSLPCLCVRLTYFNPAVDDGRTPGKTAGWSDGLTDEERQLRDFYDPKADDEDERWVVEHLKHTAISRASATAAASSDRPPIEGGPGGEKRSEEAAQPAGIDTDTGVTAPAGGGHREGRRVGGVQLPPSDAVLSCPACFGLICLDCQRHDNFSNQWRAMFAQNVRVLTEERLTVGADATAGEWYHKVLCDYCEVDVGVRDQDEVYHFFDVFPS
eukprot:COSAG02_NODE_64_length_43111_cov_35.627709_13_plen_272_part_00